jgi:hypothetical protein
MAPPIVREDEEHIQDLESDCWNSEKVDRHYALYVISEKCPPHLGRRPAMPHHVLGDGGLGDLNPELE